MFPNNAQIIIYNKLIKKIIGFLRIFIPIDYFFPGYNVIITNSIAPVKLNKNMKIYTIVHDLMGLTEKNSIESRLYAFVASKTYKRADKILSVSNNTKNELIRLLHINPDNIMEIPNVTDFTVERNTKEDIFIYIGEMRKNKNLANMILGFIEYKRRTESLTKMIICGKKDFEYSNLIALVSDCEYSKDIVFTGYINNSQKIDYFSKTKGLVLLSNSEGFGIPAIEAITNCIPVLASDIPVMHEVLSDAGIFIDQRDINAIADGYSKLEKFIITEEFISICNIVKQRYSIYAFKKLINELLEKIE